MDIDRDRLEGILRRLTPEVSERLAIERRAGARVKAETWDYDGKAAAVVADILQGCLDDPQLRELVTKFGEPATLLDTLEGTGGKWKSFQLGPDEQLYSVRWNQGSQGEPRPTTPKNGGVDYVFFDFNLRQNKPPLDVVRVHLERKVAGNIEAYLSRVESTLKI